MTCLYHRRRCLSQVCCEGGRGSQQESSEMPGAISPHGEQCRKGELSPFHLNLSCSLSKVWESCSRTGAEAALSHLSALRGAQLSAFSEAEVQLLQPLSAHQGLSAPLRGNLGFPGLSFLPVTHREQKYCLAALLSCLSLMFSFSVAQMEELVGERHPHTGNDHLLLYHHLLGPHGLDDNSKCSREVS